MFTKMSSRGSLSCRKFIRTRNSRNSMELKLKMLQLTKMIGFAAEESHRLVFISVVSLTSINMPISRLNCNSWTYLKIMFYSLKKSWFCHCLVSYFVWFRHLMNKIRRSSSLLRRSFCKLKRSLVPVSSLGRSGRPCWEQRGLDMQPSDTWTKESLQTSKKLRLRKI